MKKTQNITRNKLGIESDVEIDKCYGIGPCKTNPGQDCDRPRTVV